jgi:hypothetical protein
MRASDSPLEAAFEFGTRDRGIGSRSEDLITMQQSLYVNF